MDMKIYYVYNEMENDYINYVKHSDHKAVVETKGNRILELEKMNMKMWDLYFTDHCPSEHGLKDLGCQKK